MSPFNKKITIEIETGKSDFIKNIQRDLKASFDEVICIATNKRVDEKIRNDVGVKGIKDNRLSFKGTVRMG